MIEINLLPEKKNLLGPFQEYIIIFGCIFTAILILSGVSWTFQHRRLSHVQDSIVDLENSLNQLKEVAQKVEKLEKDKLVLIKRMDVVQRLIFDRNAWPKFLDDISKRVPEDVWLTSFTQNQEKNITVNGFSFANASLAKFMQALEKSPFIEKVVLDYAQKMMQGQDETVKFQVQLYLNKSM